MSGSEAGVMTSRDAFNVGLRQNTQPLAQNMRLAFSTDSAAAFNLAGAATSASPSVSVSASTSPTYQPSSGNGGSTTAGGAMLSVNESSMVGSGEPGKRKRGRPRKYGPDGTMSMGVTLAPQSVAGNQSSGGFSPLSTPPLSASPASFKKARGRPPGSSKKKQLDALGSAGVGFTPHVINVKAGEDISSKIMSFSQHGRRAICILSAIGAISNVTLRQPATSGGTVTYEGRFDILALSGSFQLSENGGQRSRAGSLTVSLAGPDGRVLGGGVAGLLTAASPVQVVVASFIADGRKESKSSYQMEPSTAPPKLAPGGGPAGVSGPTSRGTLSESSGGPGSPHNHSTGACNNSNPQGMPWS
ncbi:hypothetical protein I3760_08G079400 [Carya illinoinensis]|uniref:AT-hook motif nuclear-localized protein n=1 Tax=Carya illinoinensis TaxID=32201 RepID=A0A8T1PV73_CARIL|nr:AT-hook motif nuclear-localized protein 10-like [Carya illinoinensis]XP_042992814.1 AT-hook motif nuclear-localized protein 10-like [Carya illinoinensis]KAG2693008.1 hypothetical protein I3760_08G079400 [Carya illinoinensis]KAG2693009.1 hypothetical protein I3760_08G079400 [Carya illinoinensis]KAG2693010.1 hypothetical protein I3760_08G079400 [Carya illinoinensis]KAG6644780.1 hypothetical protein CIPAW_08G077200 [Carya illinoinensis]KAG6644781.1 hypothetical protein CIPAW_08G077200 [Carya 